VEEVQLWIAKDSDLVSQPMIPSVPISIPAQMNIESRQHSQVGPSELTDAVASRGRGCRGTDKLAIDK